MNQHTLSTDLNQFEAQLSPAGFFRKHGAGLIDAIILLMISFPLSAMCNIVLQLLPVYFRGWSGNIFLLLAVYRAIFLVCFDATPGMWISGIQLMNEESETPSVKQRLLAAICILKDGAAYYTVSKSGRYSQ